MPHHEPGRPGGQIGSADPKRPENPLAPVGEPDLFTQLAQLAGRSLDDLSPTIETLSGWSEALTRSGRSGFEHRVLMGLGINALRPAHGSVAAHHQRISEQLGRGTRWIRETTRVATTVDLAREQGVALPLSIRDISWRKVPSAIENLRHGRPLDFTPRKQRPELTPDERADKARKRIQALTKALDAIDSPSLRAKLAQEALDTLRPHLGDQNDQDDPAPPPAPEPPEPSPQPPEPSPEPPARPDRPRRPDRPQRPGRPGRRPKRRR
jgi:hypothetical protein